MLAARERLKSRQSTFGRRPCAGIDALARLVGDAGEVGQVGLQTEGRFAVDWVHGELFGLHFYTETDELLVDAQNERDSAFASWRAG